MLTIKRTIGMHYISGDCLRRQRLAAGMSQAELARRLTNKVGWTICQMNISRFENMYEFEVSEILLQAMQECLK
jgi:transcriptional regulator with XRE-family HTH domain